MKAWVLEDINNYKLKDVEKPLVKDGEVLIKVSSCGICGSDIPRAYQNGAHKMPLIIGHEFSGTVEECKSGKYSTGERVGVFPLIPCKECSPCLLQKYEMCRHYSYLGSRCDGGFAEYVSVPEWNLISLPDEVSFEAAAMLEPMAVAVHAIRQLGDIDKDKIFAIYGFGTIGALISMFLKGMDCKTVLVIGNKNFQRDTFVKLGFDETDFCDSRNVDVSQWIMDKTSKNGVDCFFECIGKSDTISSVVDLAAPGGKVCLVGNPYTDVSLDKAVYWKILRNQLKISGTWNSSFTGVKNDDWHYVLQCLKDGIVKPEVLITHKLSMDELVKGFEIMRDKNEDYMKIMMVCAD